MHIVHVVRQYHPSYGGLEDFVRNLVAAQKAEGYDVSVVTLDTNFQNDQKLPAHEIIDDIEVHRIPYIGSKRYSIAPAVRHYVGTADIVHVHAIDFFIDYLSLLKRLGMIKGKLIVSTHGGIFHTRSFYWVKQLFFRTVTPFSLSRSAAVVASSYSDKDLFLPIAPHIQVVENGVRLRKFGDVEAGSSGAGFLYVGRFSENKNLLNLVRWFAAAYSQDESLRLFIAGRSDGGNYAAVIDEIHRLNITQAVTVISNPSDEQIRELIARSRYVVSASQYEGFGLLVPELMSYGLVPVLSAIPSFRRFVSEGGLGKIFDFNESSFVAAIAAARADYSSADCDAAKRFALRYSWDTVALRFADVYRQKSTVGAGREALVQAIDQARIITTANERQRLLSTLLTPTEERAVVVDFLNQHAGNLLVRDNDFRSDFLSLDIILRDGAGARLAMKIFGRDEGLNMNGTDFIPAVMREYVDTHNDAPLFFLGTEEPWLSRGASALAKGHRGAVVTCNGFLDIAQYIEALQPYRSQFKLIVLAMGMPKQERIAIGLRQADIGPALILCGGAIVDFAAGRFPRAPLWMRSAGLEWLFRLAREPRRLFRRYVIGIPIFLINVLWSRATVSAKPCAQ